MSINKKDFNRVLALRFGVAVGCLLLTAGIVFAGTTRYFYDDLDRLVRVDYANGTVVQYSYDAAGNILSVTTTNCDDNDADGVCDVDDCDDVNPHCGLDCTDVDLDGFCVTNDCDDTVATCADNCGIDDDNDGLQDCADPCLDADRDGYGTPGGAPGGCVDVDCDDANPACNTDCTDGDADGYCLPVDCDDGGAPEPIDGTQLQVSRGPGAGELTLTWTGGQPAFDVFRSTTAQNVTDPGNLLGSTSGAEFLDIPPDEQALFYLVSSPCVVDCPERCDGLDNDCDGTIDGPGSEAFCGVAGAVCVAGACTIDQCPPDTYDINGDPSDGCEYACVFQASADEPDPGFVDTNCDGVDGDVSRAIFVSETLGDDLNDGETPVQAVKTITAAVTLAGAGVRDQILVDQGSYVGSLTLQSGVSIHGGYQSASAWSRSAAAVTLVAGDTPTAITATTISSSTPTMLDLLRIEPADGTALQKTSYGVHATDADGLIIRDCEIVAGEGAPGAAAGVQPPPGAFGDNGLRGNPGCENSTGFCSECPLPTGGAGGNPQCGGGGGQGGAPSDTGNGSFGANGAVGDGGAAGGIRGAGTPTGLADWDPTPLYRGTDGTKGADGADGAPGSEAFSSAGYAAVDGAAGLPGSSGGGGGGGGGGGAGFAGCNSYGGRGGGGGSGGCGSPGSPGGESGGASFAIYLWDSDATITGSRLESSKGGNGGNGADGLAGGSGGVGGNCGGTNRGNCYGGSGDQDDGSNGGRGGRGGDGGRGGHGGGGAGGPSIGILIGGDSSPGLVDLTFTIGLPGFGGTSLGNSGPQGTAATTQAAP